MVISRTPFRISLFGGGTDYPSWFRIHGGEVLTGTIDKYCYLTCRYLPPFFEHRHRVVYSEIENCQTVDEIKHPAAREILRFMKFNRGVEIHHDGDLPARSGMGSSSAFTVGLLHALYALRGIMPGKKRLAQEGIHVEQVLLKEAVGGQDQVQCAYGGINHIVFDLEGGFHVHPLPVSTPRLECLNRHLMLFFSGINRYASEVAKTYAMEIDSNKRQLRIMKDLVSEGLSTLMGEGDITGIGELLHEAWQAKRGLSDKVSNPKVDEIYARAKEAGAGGGKLLGAGGGGFMLLFVAPERQQQVREALAHLICVPFKFESGGSQIIHYQPPEDICSPVRIRPDRSNSELQASAPAPDREPKGG